MPTEFLIGPTSIGTVIRLVGRGTMCESPAFRESVESALASGAVIFDATYCEYLDSTFLGCLIGLKKSCDHTPDRRFLVAASPPIRIKLFCTSSLDHYFDFIDDCPELLEQWVAVDVGNVDRRQLGHHIMHCHERLAEMGGRESVRFQAIADRLAEELEGRVSVE